MALYKIKDFDPNYRDHFDGQDVKDLDLYSGDERIGSVNDVLVDEEGRFRYLIISTGAWIFGKKVMLPIGRARIDYNARRVYADGLTKQQAEALPELTDDLKIDRTHEEQVRNVYRPSATGAANALGSTPLDTPVGLESPTPVEGMAYAGSSMGAVDTTSDRLDYDRDTYDYGMDADLYDIDESTNPSLKLYQERLVANKSRQKTGEVAIGKHVETDTARVSVPIEKERVVIERSTPTGGTAVTPGSATFQEGEVARMEVYEETPDIHKEAFVREEVRVTKVVDQDTVDAEEQVRREELDIDTQGRPVVEGDAKSRI
ncbi:DUF2382 domain-containing protein [Phormidesmis priestleyi ULC007]|uniref:DUF2382 domain-containing protein n=1 Tax=Phormidesmis priestleyi ULC007 TaxID=1920490 RepID=A0A2T1DBV9_9CYAN|nr:DUF2382 domain-containing protein [Phormidesmis priestleyi]PSB18012.1 DUF2382 domain-containing protein [Phormidesmis priestleyi ULC007]PZO49352.1 MAG: DUF2382 domain-containing protein [Phormidesmis priestleyi]